MTEITRVPLRPIAKGSLAKLWVALAVAVLAAALIAWATMPAGVRVDTVRAGQGGYPAETDVVFVNYVGRLADGTEFDRSPPLPLPPGDEGMLPAGVPMELQNMIPGFRDALTKMQRGGSYVARIPAAMAYGDDPQGGAPPGDLTFDIELIDFMPADEFESRVQAIQQLVLRQQMLGAPDADSPGE